MTDIALSSVARKTTGDRNHCSSFSEEQPTKNTTDLDMVVANKHIGFPPGYHKTVDKKLKHGTVMFAPALKFDHQRNIDKDDRSRNGVCIILAQKTHFNKNQIGE